MKGFFGMCCRFDSDEKQTQRPPVIAKKDSGKSQKQKKKQIIKSPPKQMEQPQSTYKIRQDKYEGEQLNNIPHGNGSMLYANGDFYRGEWVNGKKEGRGLQIYQQSNYQYEGEWQNNQPHGQGKLTQANSSYYIGEFINGIKHGKGQSFNSQTKSKFAEYYSNGVLKEKKQIVLEKSKEQQFPTLVLDKQRFNTLDLEQFQESHPEIQNVEVNFFLKYFGMCKLINLQFVGKKMKQWSIKEVLIYLQSIELKGYKQIFYQNKIKGKDLVSLTQKQMKQDLKMKMGDRKRLMNYISFFSEEKQAQKKVQKQSKSTSSKKEKEKYKLKSANSMKKVLKNVSKFGLQESIRQQELQSSSQSDKYRSTYHKINIKQNNILYGSYRDSIEDKFIQKSIKQKNSFEELIQPLSENIGQVIQKKKQSFRKQSKEVLDPDHMSNSQQNKNNNLSIKLNDAQFQEKKSLRDQMGKRSDDQRDDEGSQSSKEDQLFELQRKKTYNQKPNSSSEIRELYQFLKQRGSLDFLIKQKNIQKLQLIGEGGFGKVYKGKYVGQLIAIKDYLKTGKDHHKQDFMKQLDIISDLKHPNIVLYMGMCITANKYTLITEFLQNGSLFDQLHKKKKKFTQQQQLDIAFDIVKGMVYLHNMKKIIHRDLKSSNVLIGQDWNVKVCDFGLSGQEKKQKKKNSNRQGTFQWMAPEVVLNQQINFSSDVYSFGVILWEMLSQKIPYEGLSEVQIIALVGYDQNHRLQEPQGCSFLVKIMNKSLNRVASERPTFMDIQQEFEEYFAFQKNKQRNS